MDQLADILLEYLRNNSLFTVVFLTILLIRIKLLAQNNLLSVWAIEMFGTFFHELMHLIFSSLLNGKPTRVSLFPKRVEDGFILGYVQSSNIRWYNAFPIAMAPIILMYFAFYVNQNFFYYFEDNLVTYIVYIYVQVSLIDSSIPSTQDFKVAFGNLGFVLYLSIPIFYYFDIIEYF